MDGYESVAAIRAHGIQKPIVALTANAMKGYEQKVLAAGFSHYMSKPIDLDRLTELLADLLGGTYVESELPDHNDRMSSEFVTPTTAIEPTPQTTPQTTLADNKPVYSLMAQQNPKFAVIAKQFVSRLEEKLQEMQQCAQAEDFVAVGNDAHWLKGSGGTVGFTQFIEPASLLEAAAKQNNSMGVQQQLGVIRDIKSRIRFDDVETTLQNVPESVTQLPELNQTVANETSVSESSGDQVASIHSRNGEPVMCSLPMSNARFRGIVEKFLPRLDQQVIAFQLAIDDSDFDELVQLAHWLKGSGGNVGFAGFTELAASLEASAKAADMNKTKQNFAAIHDYSTRVNQGWKLLAPLDKSA